MPYTIRKVRGKRCYSLKNKKTKKAYSKCTSRKKVKAQLRLLNAIEHNPKFVPRNYTFSHLKRPFFHF
jgi:hypothetical protein